MTATFFYQLAFCFMALGIIIETMLSVFERLDEETDNAS